MSSVLISRNTLSCLPSQHRSPSFPLRKTCLRDWGYSPVVECMCKALGFKSTTAEPNQRPIYGEQGGFIGNNLLCLGWCVVNRQHTQHCFCIGACGANLFLRHKLPTLRLSLPRLPEGCFSGTWESIGHRVVKEVRSPHVPGLQLCQLC